MSQTISIANKPEGDGLASNSQSHKPKRADDVIWRLDGENDQIVIVNKEDLPLPMILNVTASKIFSLCGGDNSIEDIARLMCEEFSGVDFLKVLEDVKYQVSCFLEEGIVCLI